MVVHRSILSIYLTCQSFSATGNLLVHLVVRNHRRLILVVGVFADLSLLLSQLEDKEHDCQHDNQQSSHGRRQNLSLFAAKAGAKKVIAIDASATTKDKNNSGDNASNLNNSGSNEKKSSDNYDDDVQVVDIKTREDKVGELVTLSSSEDETEDNNQKHTNQKYNDWKNRQKREEIDREELRREELRRERYELERDRERYKKKSIS